MTAPPAGALEACLALLEKATPGQWEVLGDNQGHPAGLEWTIEAPEIANEDDSGWIAGPHGGDGIATTGNPGCREDAEAMAAAVNLLKDHGPALLAALRLREWRPIESAPKGQKNVIVLIATNGPNGYVTDPWTGWVCADGEFARWPHQFPPTHWMPLPAPPTAADLARVLEQTK